MESESELESDRQDFFSSVTYAILGDIEGVFEVRVDSEDSVSTLKHMLKCSVVTRTGPWTRAKTGSETLHTDSRNLSFRVRGPAHGLC